MAKDTKEKILDAAKVLFSKNGFDGCNVDVIADKAMVNKATIYYHFKSKAILYETVLELNLRKFLHRVRKEIQKETSPVAQLKAFIYAYASNFAGNKHMAPIMLRELASDGTHITGKIRGILQEIILEVDTILHDGRKAGQFQKTKTFLPYFMIVGSMNIYTSTSSMRKAFTEQDNDFGFSLTIDDAADELCSIILDGVKI